MSRFRSAGLLALGQTTAPVFGLNFATEPARHGPTRSPWALDRGTGGSSGGAEALVAAGAVPAGARQRRRGSRSACRLLLRARRLAESRPPAAPWSARPGSGTSTSSPSPERSATLPICSMPWPARRSGKVHRPDAVRSLRRHDARRTRPSAGGSDDRAVGREFGRTQVGAAALAAGATLEWIGYRDRDAPSVRRGGRRRGVDAHCGRCRRGDPPSSAQARSRSA